MQNQEIFKKLSRELGISITEFEEAHGIIGSVKEIKTFKKAFRLSRNNQRFDQEDREKFLTMALFLVETFTDAYDVYEDTPRDSILSAMAFNKLKSLVTTFEEAWVLCCCEPSMSHHCKPFIRMMAELSCLALEKATCQSDTLTLYLDASDGSPIKPAALRKMVELEKAAQPA